MDRKRLSIARHDMIDGKRWKGQEAMNMVIWNIVHGFMERAVVAFLLC